MVGRDFLRARTSDVAGPASAGGSEIVLDKLRSELVDALRFPETVERFLDGEWRAWNGDDVGEDGDDPVEEEIRTWKALHRDIVSEYGSNMSLNTYLQQMDLSSKSPPPPANAIRCMTVHGAKRVGIRARVSDWNGAAGVSVLPRTSSWADEHTGRGGAQELLRGHYAGTGDVDPDPGSDLLRVFETAVAVLVGDGFGAIGRAVRTE